MNLIMKIVWIFIIGIVCLTSGLVYNSVKCNSDCRSNPENIKYANTSGHGIEHVCYDICTGGVA